MPNLRAAALRQSATEVGIEGIEGLAAVATSTTTQTILAGLAFNGLDGIRPTGRGLLMDAQKGFAFVVDYTQAKEFALARWLVNGADGGRLSCAGNVRLRRVEARWWSDVRAVAGKAHDAI